MGGKVLNYTCHDCLFQIRLSYLNQLKISSEKEEFNKE